MAEPIKLHTQVIPAPHWKTRAEALEYLGGEFADWLRACTDMRLAEVPIPDMLFEDLALIAEVLADVATARKLPRIDSADDAFIEWEKIALATEGLVQKIDGQGEFETAEGLGAAVSYNTLPLLTRALVNAARGLEGERQLGESNRDRAA